MAALTAGALLASIVVVAVVSDPPPPTFAGILTGAGAIILFLSIWRRKWELPLHLAAAALLGLVVWWAEDRIEWLSVLVTLGIFATFWIAVAQARRRTRDAEAKADQLAVQVDRRISELFSLQELSYVLSESIQLDRVVDQVARYAARFLQTEGAIVVLVEMEGRALRVVAASGTLESLVGQVSEDTEEALVRLAIGGDRIEVAQGTETPTVNLIGGLMVRSAAVVPLRAQGTTMGALAVADRRGGPFTTEDLWLLSTVATNASVVVANSRLYEMVRRSEEEWETAFNALAEGIAVVGLEGAILRANRALAELAELPESELVGRDFCELLPGTSEAMTGLIEAAYRKEKTAPLVVRLEHNHRVLRLTGAPLAGVQPSVVILIEDVTEQRMLEAQIIQNDKMASIGQLVSGVAHELNNPLTSIAGLAELLLERPPHLEFPREHLRVIHDQAERAGRIVRNLLTFARKGVAEKTAVDLNDVVTRTSMLIMYELQLHGIDLDSELSPDPVVVLGDRYELQQVLLNLITNAVQAVGGLEPGKIRRITLITDCSDSEAVLRVRDTGPGVPKHLAPYLFTPFFTTKAPGEGTGLGLSLSYGLVKAHGGTLTYDPSPEGGAEFRVTLPLYQAAVAMPPEQPPVARNGPVASRRILVVDEDPAVHRLVSALFAPEGHAVESVRSSEQGLRLAQEGEYDLIIVDGQMAAGAEEPFAHALLDACPHVRQRLVVACAREDLPAPLAEQPFRRVTKPFNLRDLRMVAREILQ
jgi:PAS domain S-box-containing protein